MTAEPTDDVTSKVLKQLEGTPYAAGSLTPLKGGTANFIYHASLTTPLEDGTTEVAIKHGEGYSASNRDFPLATARCGVEEECLTALSTSPVIGRTTAEDAYNFAVRTPKFYHFDEENSTQIQEYLPRGINLKNYALENYPSPTPESLKPQCLQLGIAVGRWLRGFHDFAAKQPSLQATVEKNEEMRKLKLMINFDWLMPRVKKFPSALGDAVSIFEKVKEMAIAESQDKDRIQVIHGDFWSGNVLLPNVPIAEGAETTVFVIDWEMAEIGVRNFDTGQMIAELWELWLYKKIDAGLWLVQGFAEGYGRESDDFAFRTAMQVGVHLVCFGSVVPGWGTLEQNEEIARIGKEVIVNAWEKNRGWFEKHDLGCLFTS